MTRQRTRNRAAFGLESLEIRNAPSHFGVAAHVAAIHAIHTTAHVRHITDSEVNRQKELKESGTSVDSSQDGASDPASTDTTSNDPSSVDPKSDR